MGSRTCFGFLLCLGCFLGCQHDIPLPAPDDTLPRIELDIDRSAFDKIKRKRSEALALGLLESSGKDFVPCRLRLDSSSFLAEIRLKGDWLDHLKGNQWSWRVKLAEGAILGMQQFSLQHPKTRSYLMEWVFHQLLQQEGMLSPRYQFVQLWLNGEYKGVYALEEHFTSDLLAYYEQPESVLLKFDESGFWESQNYRLRYGKNVTPHLPVFESANIDCFQSSRTKEDPRLSALFAGGQLRMEQLRSTLDTQRMDQVIDYDYWARFFALIDLTEAYHALRWHNMRFYYHPTEARLYPIGFDGYGSDGIVRWFRKPFTGYVPRVYPEVYFAEEFFLYKLFNDPAFRTIYAAYLDRYTTADFLDSFFAKIGPEIKKLNALLQETYQQPPYDQRPIYQRADLLRDSLAQYDWSRDYFRYTIYEPLFEECKTTVPLASIGLQAQLLDDQHIRLRNYYCQDIRVEATGPKRNKPLHPLTPALTLEAFVMRPESPPSTTLDLPKGDRYVFYSIAGVDYWFKTKIGHLLPAFDTRRMNLNLPPLDTTVFKREGKHLRVRAGLHQIHSLQYVPPRYTLLIEAGARIDLMEGAALFVAGAADLRGSKTSPIHVFSSDGTGRGLHILEGTGPSMLSHVHFNGLQTYTEAGRWFNGAVSVHHRSLLIRDCRFEQMAAEDALNIVACDSITLSKLSFSNCQGDALDIDFSSGQLTKLYFEHCAGDALDISGSKLELRDLQAIQIADKGLSIGEASALIATDIQVEKALIGVALKDGSQAQIDGLQLRNCTYGVAAFRKKSIYPPGLLQLSQLQWDEQTTTPFLNETPYVILHDRQKVAATYAPGELAKRFYPDTDQMRPGE